jgi:hypothetical protein
MMGKDDFSSAAVRDHIWQLALVAGILHYGFMKIPHRPDTALRIVPSAIVANIACVGLFLLKSAPIREWAPLWTFFNVIFVNSNGHSLTLVLNHHGHGCYSQRLLPSP